MRPDAAVPAASTTELMTAHTRNSSSANISDAPDRERSLFFILSIILPRSLRAAFRLFCQDSGVPGSLPVGPDSSGAPDSFTVSVHHFSALYPLGAVFSWM